jgi:hypothetical protein
MVTRNHLTLDSPTRTLASVGKSGQDWRVSGRVPRGTAYRPLANDDAGPAGQMYGPAVVEVIIDGPGHTTRPYVQRATATLELIDAVYRMTSFEAHGPKRSWLDFEQIRSLPLAELLPIALAKKVTLKTADGKTYSAKRPLPDADHLWWVAEVYVIARVLRKNPVAEVARALGISRDAAAQQIYRARNEKGYLAPTEPGKVS